MRVRRAALGSILTLAVISLRAAQAQPVVLYDVDFSAPTHALGTTPTVGSGPLPRATPTDISFLGGGAADSSATVVSSFGALTDRPVVLEGDGSQSSIVTILFGLDDARTHDADSYRLEFDLIIDALPTNADHFTLFIDAPSVNRLQFTAAGELTVFNTALVATQTIGTYQTGALLSVAIDFDQLQWIWSIAVNGQTLFSGPAGGTGATAIRINLARIDPSGSASSVRRVALDGVRITAVPEPGRLVGFVAALASLALASALRGYSCAQSGCASRRVAAIDRDRAR